MRRRILTLCLVYLALLAGFLLFLHENRSAEGFDAVGTSGVHFTGAIEFPSPELYIAVVVVGLSILGILVWLVSLLPERS